jgi:hypothetical protein
LTAIDYKEAQKEMRRKWEAAGKGKGVRSNTSWCEQCKVPAHNMLLGDDNNYIHALFPGKSCMEILHSTTGREVWRIRRSKVSVNYKHPTVKAIRKAVNEFIDTN